MTGLPGDSVGTTSSGQRRREWIRPVSAALAVCSPIVLLVLADGIVLLRAFADPSSTCWLRAQVEAGRRLVFPFEVHLLVFTATMQIWAPILLLAAALFWYLGWIRVRGLLAAAVLSGLALYVVGVDYQWLADLYRGRFDAACG